MRGFSCRRHSKGSSVCPPCVLMVVFLLLVLVLADGITTYAVADNGIDCATEDAQRLGASVVPASGTVKGLFVLARFKDDNRADWGNDWPIDTTATRRDALPSWAADSLVEDVTSPTSPTIEGSLTHYYHYMSRGALRLNGAVYNSVIVLSKTIEEYYDDYGGGYEGVKQASNDVLDSLDVEGFNFSPFVNHFPGAPGKPDSLDYFCVIFRGCATYKSCDKDSVILINNYANGMANYGAHPAPSDTVAAGAWLRSWVTGRGTRVPVPDYPDSQPGTIPCESGECDSCPVNNTSLASYRQVILHEIGHSLYANSTFMGIANHIWECGNWELMYSRGRGQIMHSFPRIELGWIEPIVITEGTETTIKVYDSVTWDAPNFDSAGGDSIVYKIVPDPQDPSQYFLLENRRASTVYAETFVASSTLKQVTHPGSGLLITHVNTGGYSTEHWWEPKCPPPSLKKHLNVETAYGLWDLDFEPNPVDGWSRISADFRMLNSTHAHDLFGPGTNNAFTPYTCPNTNLYDATDSMQTIGSGLSIVNIRDGADSSVIADVLWEQPRNSTDGNITWDGLVMLTDDFEVADRDTVTVEPGSRVLFRGAGPLASGEGIDTARVELLLSGDGQLKVTDSIDEGPRFFSSRDTTARLGPKPDGDLLFVDYTEWCYYPPQDPDTTVITMYSPAPGDWYGLRLAGLDNLDPGLASLKHARAAFAVEDTLFPNPSRYIGPVRISVSENLMDFSFDRDVVVPLDSTVTVKKNTVLGFAPFGGDNQNIGSSADLVELIVRGNIDFQGQDYYNQVKLVSGLVPYDSVSARGSWWGMRLESFPPDSGRCADDREIDFTLFRDAVYGMAMVDSCGPNMTWPLFENNSEADIYLDRDISIPEGRRWNLKAPTRVVATANSSAEDISIWRPDTSHDGIVDLIVRGELVTKRPEFKPVSDSLWFESTARDSVNADDWGGIYVDWKSDTTRIEDAAVGYADNPVFAYGCENFTLRDSRIHHYNTGVWINEMHGATIRDNLFERGGGLSSAKGMMGLLMKKSSAWVYGNRIGEHLNAGVEVQNTKTYCETDPQSPDTLHVEGNVITGPGAGVGGADRPSGLAMAWACGSNNRKVIVEADSILDWNDHGMELNQNVDVQVECNWIMQNRNAVDFARNTSASGPGVRFKSNRVEIDSVEAPQYLFRTDNVLKLKLGSSNTSDRGTNVFAIDTTTALFIDSSYTCASDTLDARRNYWYLNGSATTDTSQIRPYVLPCTNIENPLNPGIVIIPACIRGSENIEKHGEGVYDELEGGQFAGDGTICAVPGGELPLVTTLGMPRPCPFRTETWVDLAIAGGAAVVARVDVYDVSGRRVHRPVERILPPGRYVIRWDGRNRDGKSLASGVYFLRLHAGSFIQTRKVILVH
jgi:hypothetical protein